MKNKKETNNKFKKVREVLKASNYKKSYLKYGSFVALGGAVLYMVLQVFVGLINMLSLSLGMPDAYFTNKFVFILTITLVGGLFLCRHFFHRSLVWLDCGCGGLRHIWKLDTDTKYKAMVNSDTNVSDYKE